MAEKKFSLRNEEMPVVGRFVFESFERDYADFVDYSPDFNDAYKASFLAKLEEVENLVNPKKVLNEQKKTTATLYENIDSLRPILAKLEGYVERAGDDLSILVDDFGFKEVRRKIDNKDQEALLENLKILLQNVADNMVLLEAKGWNVAKNDELVALRDEISSGNIEQNAKMDERNLNTDASITTMNELWDIMRDVMETGQQRLYKFENTKKADDYTVTTLKGRIRSEVQNKKNNG